MRQGNLRELVTLGALDDVVQDQNITVVTALKDQDVLVLRFLVVQDLVDFQSHRLAGPHVRDLAEPAIYQYMPVSHVRRPFSFHSIRREAL